MGGYSGNLHEPETQNIVYRSTGCHDRTVFEYHFPCVTGRSGSLKSMQSLHYRPPNPQAFPSDPDRSQQTLQKMMDHTGDCRGFPGDFVIAPESGNRGLKSDGRWQTTEDRRRGQRFFSSSVIRHPTDDSPKQPDLNLHPWSAMPVLQSQRENSGH